jgi:hypothetical protein
MKTKAFMASIIAEPAAPVEDASTIRSIGKATAASIHASAAARPKGNPRPGPGPLRQRSLAASAA